jgi:hypothetical protein
MKNYKDIRKIAAQKSNLQKRWMSGSGHHKVGARNTLALSKVPVSLHKHLKPEQHDQE